MKDTRKDRLAWFAFYPADWTLHTSGWPNHAVGAALRLLCLQWDRGALPTDRRTLRELAASTHDEWRSAWPYIERTFPKIGRDIRQNADLEQARQEAHGVRARRQEASQKGHAVRWKDTRLAKRTTVVRLRHDGRDDA